MGIDAELAIETPARLSDAEVEDLARRFAEANPVVAWIRDGPCLTREDPGEASRTDVDASRLLVVSTAQRYYGEAYPRGPCNELRRALEWLESETGGRALYGDDDRGAWQLRDCWAEELDPRWKLDEKEVSA